MENKFIIDDCRVSGYEDSQKDAVWRISSLKNEGSEFAVHVSHNGLMYITHFPGCKIPFRKQANIICTFCKKLQQEGMNLQIRIKAENTTLKRLCLSAGFKYLKREYSKRNLYHIYYFPS